MSNCARGVRSVAALLAAWTITPGWRAASARAHGVNSSSCALEEAVVRALVGGREMRHQASQLRPPVARSPPAQRRASRSIRIARPEPAHPGVQLDVHRPPPAARDGVARNCSLQTTTSASAASACASSVRRQRAHHEHPHLAQAGLAQLARLARRRHRQPARAARRAPRARSAPRRARSRRPSRPRTARAVAQLGAQARAVALDRRQVHARLRALGRSAARLIVWPPCPAAPRRAGSAAITSDAITPSGAPRARAASRPASRMQPHPGARPP